MKARQSVFACKLREGLREERQSVLRSGVARQKENALPYVRRAKMLRVTGEVRASQGTSNEERVRVSERLARLALVPQSRASSVFAVPSQKRAKGNELKRY